MEHKGRLDDFAYVSKNQAETSVLFELIGSDVAPNFYPVAIGVGRSVELLPVLGPACRTFSRPHRSGRADCP
jgi:hypothetical protein